MHVWICICHIASVYMQMLVYFNIYILAKLWSLKRGRGRPRKDSLYSNFSNTQNSYLEEGKLFGVFDLYFFFVIIVLQTTYYLCVIHTHTQTKLMLCTLNLFYFPLFFFWLRNQIFFWFFL